MAWFFDLEQCALELFFMFPLLLLWFESSMIIAIVFWSTCKDDGLHIVMWMSKMFAKC